MSPGGAAAAFVPEAPSPFFVLGPPKSGTSWMQAVLNSHPEVFCSSEGKLFGRSFSKDDPYGQWGAEVSAAMSGLGYEGANRKSLYEALADSKDLKAWFNRNGGWTKNEDTERHVRALVRLSMDYVFAQGRQRSEKSLVGDKSPSHIRYIEEISEFYPDSKVIHIVRDGRDHAISSVFHWWRQATDRGGFFPLSGEQTARRDAYYEDRSAFSPEGESLFDETTLRAFAANWREVVGRAREDGPKLFPGRYHEVRYEELLERPEELFAGIFAFLEVGTDRGTIAGIVETNSFEKRTNRALGEEDPKSFLRSGKAGEWRGRFTRRDHEVYEEEAGELLALLGYETN